MDDRNIREQLVHGEHAAVQIVNSDEELSSSMKEKMEKFSPSLCIYIAPENLQKGNENAFAPEIVSIGPFHHGKQGLESMEKHKWRYLRALLTRKPNLETTFDDCVKAIRQLEQRARKCYEEPINMGSNEFVEMMIVDGCFLIELFLNYSIKGLRHRWDLIFSKNWMLFSVRSDMILLENQLPFFVLQRLFDLVPVPKQCDQSLLQLAFRFFKIILPAGDEEVLQVKFTREGNHLLDLVRNCYLPSFPRVLAKKNETQRSINSAEKLKQSGIKFKKANNTDSLLDVKFAKGTLKIPPLKIHNYTNAILRNLIALEQCSKGCTLHITSYVFFMDGLIQSPQDMKLLHGRGIIANCIGSDDMVPEFFKKLCDEIIVKDFYYAGLCEQVNAYKRTNWFNYF
ncbi:Protein of unknown function DUF247 [Macleaya cordata]|uniref:Uncharacterized protein n=1 Tax=Macleaya cordata TaxID=56857 RepID=A0A200R231_MACCD|nr:Protein of unknown function DUF247 [Macleaya cordata]